MVGHSLGGALIRLFEERHPESVAVMVFVDSAHPEYESRIASVIKASSLKTEYKITDLEDSQRKIQERSLSP